MFCHKCGTQIPEEAAFCPKCGAKVVSVDGESHPTSQAADKQVKSTSNKGTKQPPAAPPKALSGLFKKSKILVYGLLGLAAILSIVVLGALMKNSQSEDTSSNTSPNDSNLMSSSPEDERVGDSSDDVPETEEDPSNPNESTSDTPAEYLKFVEMGDEYSFVTLYDDGTFAMDVNLYVGYGTLRGTYEENGRWFKFHVNERNFSGYIGDDVDEFEMVIEEYGVVEYIGDPIGAVEEGYSVYDVIGLSSPTWDEDDIPSDNLPVLPDGFEWVEAPSIITKPPGIQCVVGIIQNTSDSSKSYTGISFNLYDADGYRIDQAHDYIRDLGKGEQWKFSAGSAADFASFEFSELTAW